MMTIALACSAGVATAQQAGGGGQLDELHDAIRQSRERVSGHERQQRELLDQLEEIDRNLEELAGRVSAAQEAAEEARAQLALMETERTRLGAQLAATRRAMSARVVALYKAGEVGPVRVLFSSTSLTELLARMSALRALVEYDGGLVARFRRDQANLEAAGRLAGVAAVRLEEAATQLRERSESVAVERGSRRTLLARVRGDRAQERALLIELEQAARALEQTLVTLRDRPGSASLDGLGFERRRGRLARPVDADVALGFGRIVDAEFLTETFRKGVELGAPAGDTVRAVAPGEVRFAGWFRGYGRIAIIDHGDRYFTVSGHLADLFVDVGDPVGEGDTIGSVGETGSLSGPSLYFEIREGSEPVDPTLWLAPR